MDAKHKFLNKNLQISNIYIIFVCVKKYETELFLIVGN